LNSLIRPLAILALVVMCSVGLSACSRTFFIELSGGYGQVIVFRFYDLADRSPSKHNIVELTVQEKQDNDKWQVVWTLTGKQSLAEVEYGGQYEGLKEAAPAKPLSLAHQYRVYVTDRASLEPIGYAFAEFGFDQSGALLRKRNPSERRPNLVDN